MDREEEVVKEVRAAYQVGGQVALAEDRQEQYVVNREGKRVGVILSFERYQQMREDLHDLAVVAERRGEESISLEEMKRRLREDGLLSPCLPAIGP